MKNITQVFKVLFLSTGELTKMEGEVPSTELLQKFTKILPTFSNLTKKKRNNSD